MIKHARISALVLAIAGAAVGCAPAPTYNPPDGPSAANRCSVNEVWVCHDRDPSRLDRENEPPMFCTCQNVHGIH